MSRGICQATLIRRRLAVVIRTSATSVSMRE
jgi:hypothetical protein